MFKAEKGFAFPKNGKLTVYQTVNIRTLESELESYYSKTNENFSKRGAPLKAKKTAIDRKRLAIVAFVQDDMTREILQSATEKIVDKNNAKMN